MIKELDVVELLEDLPEYGLKRGDTGTVLEIFCRDNPAVVEAYLLECNVDQWGKGVIADVVYPHQVKRYVSQYVSHRLNEEKAGSAQEHCSLCGEVIPTAFVRKRYV